MSDDKTYHREQNTGNLSVEQEKLIQNFLAITVVFSLPSPSLHA